ncbi:MAG: threonylcarbamoyl-AMP synthase [Fimbriimonadaceae bacterium]|nr:threonylcarbamoyl-AMP synthase [Fimbriimonadaceae bacterium]
MSTCLLAASDPTALDRAAAALQAGEVVVVPTETVYGVAALVTAAPAAEAIYALKGRPADKPLQVLVPDAAAAAALTADWPPLAARLATDHWPGGLTMVLPAGIVPPAAQAGDGSIGLRCPDHPWLLALLRRVGPLVASSANRTGQPPATTAPAAAAALAGLVSLVIDGGESRRGLASTVVRVLADGLQVLRPGPLTTAELERYGQLR